MVYGVWVINKKQWIIDKYNLFFGRHKASLLKIINLQKNAEFNQLKGNGGVALSLIDEIIAMSIVIQSERKTFDTSFGNWCCEDGICNETELFDLYCRAMQIYVNWLNFDSLIGKVGNK